MGLALALAWPACAATVCNVRDHGARGDGKTLDTAAILACLGDQVPTVVLLPAPGRYLSAPFNLSSSTTLRVQSGATLLASDNASLWPVVADLPSYPRPVENDGNMTGRYAPFIGTDSHAHLQRKPQAHHPAIRHRRALWYLGLLLQLKTQVHHPVRCRQRALLRQCRLLQTKLE